MPGPARRGKKPRVEVGDVFTIPIADGARAYGQVIGAEGQRNEAPFVVIFRTTDRGDSLCIDAALVSGIELAGSVFDAKFRNGDWPIHERRPPVATPASLWYQAGNPKLGNLRLYSHDGSMRRHCTEEEAAQYDRKHHASPMVLQLAAAASRGFIPSRESFGYFHRDAERLRAAAQSLKGH